MSNQFFRFLIPVKGLRKILKERFNLVQNISEQLLIKSVKKKYRYAIEKISGKDKYLVVFFMTESTSWKYNALYEQMIESDCFEPIVVIIPFFSENEKIMRLRMKEASDFCKKFGLKYIDAFDENQGKYLDIKVLLDPDIVFFGHPYLGKMKQYTVLHFLDVLTCWVPYSIRQENLHLKGFFDQLSHNLFWRSYCESEIHLKLAKKYARNKGKNMVATGHPVIDTIRNTPKNNRSWNIESKDKKRIIWAPHWTIPGYQESFLNWSNFLYYADYMLELARKFQDEIYFSFKPHPLLRRVLNQDILWGLSRTNSYFKKWDEIGQVNESVYMQLFVDSDALIHDCGSFTIEYLAVNKPVLYCLRDSDIKKQFNEYGQRALESHYIAITKEHIYNFIKNTVLGNEDTLKRSRENFNKYMLNSEDKSSSEKIISDLLTNLKKN